MLVLSRKKNESIMIGDHIEIKVISVEGETVRIGISAPREVDVHRKEVYSAIQEENRLASQSKLDWAHIRRFMQQEPPKS
ncbi:carbon storage regulator CsrA [Brevibacillus dissolubilis]|uniref:carbon storage regulator CsrA n=1 Tax=Brevibacillus dissolubilis TaxID=1844116 RepID=UPI0011177CE3|nr:carbon storage regulator CsrA [Brevibacillus dissolubilis]